MRLNYISNKLLIIFITSGLFFSNIAFAIQWEFMFNFEGQNKEDKIAIFVDKDSIAKKGDITELTLRFNSSMYPNSSVDCKNKKLYVRANDYSIDGKDNPIYKIACIGVKERIWESMKNLFYEN